MLTSHLSHFISGKKYRGNSTRTGDIFNPSTGEKSAIVPFADQADLNAAVNAAQNAQRSWADVTPLRRARVMFRFNELISKYHDDLATLISEEHGKVFEDAKAEVTRGREVVEFACGAPQLLKGTYSNDVGSQVDCYSMRQPVGVCAGITPFNFPAMVPLWMFPIAIAAGNSFILKPSEKDPSVTMRLAELLQEAGLPDGVLNIVHGDKFIVDAILSHPGIHAVSFVGSTPIAKMIYEKAAQSGKRVQALGGAKNHCVVMPDANIEDAANGLIGAAYGSAGERCMAISVAVVVGNQTADQLVELLVQKASALRVSPSLEKGAEMGPLISALHLARVRDFVAQGEKAGAKLLVDGRKIKVNNDKQGYFLGPCLFDHVTPDMSIYQEEIFGPVLSVVRVHHFDDALTLINNNPYGNGVSIFTKNGAAAHRFARDITVGMVGVNTPIPVPMAFHSFGGWKNSLFGDTHMHGMEGFYFYTRQKTVTMRWPSEQITEAEFIMPVME